MSGVQVSAGATDSSAVVLAPPQQQQKQQRGQDVTVTQLSPEAVDEIIRRYKAFPKLEADQLDEMRGWLMVLATLTASITYSAMFNPPGGVWQADDAANGYVAGNPVFRDRRPRQYTAFAYCNFTSFVSSVFIIAILSTPKFFNMSKMKVCNMLVGLDIIALMGAALIAGSAGSKRDYIFQGILLLSVLVYISLARIFEWLKQNA